MEGGGLIFGLVLGHDGGAGALERGGGEGGVGWGVVVGVVGGGLTFGLVLGHDGDGSAGAL